MNVQELIAALQQQDPNAPAGDAVKLARQQAFEAAAKRLTTKDGVAAAYPSVLERVTNARDKKGNTNDNPKREAFNAIRSEVHEALMYFDPIPGPHPDDEGDPDMLHARQKMHGKKLWKQADALVKAAGITEEGVV